MVKDTKRDGKIALFDKALIIALALGFWQCVQCGSAEFQNFYAVGKKN